MAKTFYLIAGANGSGKTTLAHELLKDEKELAFLNSDEVAKKINDDIGLESGKIILRKLEELFAAGRSIVLESTISGNYHEKIIRRAKKLKYKIILIYVFLDDVKLNILRIEQRVALGGHNIPKADVIRRFGKSIKNFWNLLPIVDEWKLYYNGETNYEFVADNLAVLNDELYNKFKKGLK